MSIQAGIDIAVTAITQNDGASAVTLQMRNPITLQRDGVLLRLYCGSPERQLTEVIAASEAGMAQARRVAAEQGVAQIIPVPGGFPGRETVTVTVPVNTKLPASATCRAEMRGVW